MTALRISSSTSLPPAFNARERAVVDAYFGVRAQTARAGAFWSSLFGTLFAAAAIAAAVAGSGWTAHAASVAAPAHTITFAHKG